MLPVILTLSTLAMMVTLIILCVWKMRKNNKSNLGYTRVDPSSCTHITDGHRLAIPYPPPYSAVQLDDSMGYFYHLQSSPPPLYSELPFDNTYQVELSPEYSEIY